MAQSGEQSNGGLTYEAEGVAPDHPHGGGVLLCQV